MKRILLQLLLSLTVVVALPAHAVEVLASIRPLALIAHAVVVEPTQVRQLLPDGASAHHPSLRPSDRKALATADIVLRVGPAHEAFLDAALARRKGAVINAQALPGVQLLKERQRDGTALSRGQIDPHLWLSPENAVIIARELAEALAAKDPASASRYRHNARQFAEQLGAAVAALNKKSVPARYVAYHDAYQYLETLLALQFRGSLTADAESKPGAKHLQFLAKRIADEQIVCLLAEPGFDQGLVKRAAGKVAMRFVEIDEMFTDAPMSGAGYIQGLLGIAKGIARCATVH